MIKKGSMVESDYGYTGMVVDEFESWEDLKNKTAFVTLDPDNESDEMDDIEKLINGDPKDEWLKVQSNPFTEEQLNEKWYSVQCVLGGGIWSCKSRLKLTQQN